MGRKAKNLVPRVNISTGLETLRIFSRTELLEFLLLRDFSVNSCIILSLPRREYILDSLRPENPEEHISRILRPQRKHIHIHASSHPPVSHIANQHQSF